MSSQVLIKLSSCNAGWRSQNGAVPWIWASIDSENPFVHLYNRSFGRIGTSKLTYLPNRKFDSQMQQTAFKILKQIKQTKNLFCLLRFWCKTELLYNTTPKTAELDLVFQILGYCINAHVWAIPQRKVSLAHMLGPPMGNTLGRFWLLECSLCNMLTGNNPRLMPHTLDVFFMSFNVLVALHHVPSESNNSLRPHRLAAQNVFIPDWSQQVSSREDNSVKLNFVIFIFLHMQAFTPDPETSIKKYFSSVFCALRWL